MIDLNKIKTVIIQGITGKQGSFHCRKMLEFGTPIIAGVSNNNRIKQIESIPVFDSIQNIKKSLNISKIDATVIFVPAPNCKKAIFEAIDNNIKLIVCITEHIPIHDMIKINKRTKGTKTVLIGANTAGVAFIPQKIKLGIIPNEILKNGNIGLISRSGTLMYEVLHNLKNKNLGTNSVVGIGGDLISGIDFKNVLNMYQNNKEIERIILIGEVGGIEEINAGNYIKKHISKPVYVFIAGQNAPKNTRLGHAGAILKSTRESALEKTTFLSKIPNIKTFRSIDELINSL